MGRGNTAIVQDIYAAFVEGRIDDILSRLADRLAFIQPGGDEIPWSGTYRTPGEVAGFFTKLDQAVEVQHFEPRQYVESVDTVVAMGAWGGVWKATGKAFACDWSMTWKLRDGKVYFYQAFFDTATVSRPFRQAAAAP